MAVLVAMAFIIGAMTVLVLEAVGLWLLIRRLHRKVVEEENKTNTAVASVDTPFLYGKQGTLWILEPDKIPKSKLEEKVPAEQRRRKEILEVTPVRKNARIIDHCLILTESDLPRVEISLRGCTVVAVSATENPLRKWAKRFPIKIENKDSAIYRGSRIIYLYLKTSWEKESWCKALRLASCDDDERTTLFSKLSMEFQSYLASLNAGYPSFMKPSAGPNAEFTDRSVKLDNPSRVRQFLKKLAKKASKSGHDYKPSGPSISGLEERKLNSKSHSFQDMIMPNDSAKLVTSGRVPNISSDDTSMTSSVSTSNEQGTDSHIAGLFEADSNESKDKYTDEGTLCLNMVISRLFFDAKNNPQLKSSLHNRIQRAMSNMRMPSYIGEVTCTAVDVGSLPPRILGMRVLPSDMSEVWSLEIDVDYLGGMVLDVETRFDLREFEEDESRLSGNSDGVVTSDLLEGFEYLGEQVKLPEETIYEGPLDKGDETDEPRSTRNEPSQGSRWKSLLHSITKQVSQVPLSLRIRVSSLCGTIRVCMKPPPSDQIWFGFTSMPDIQLNLESSVGDHKITNSRLALFMISRFKVAIHETLVLPNSEYIILPWMLAEKDDWIPRKAAPFMWYKNNQDSTGKPSKQEEQSFQPGELAHNVESNHGNSTRPEVDNEMSKAVGPISQPQVTAESVGPCASSSSSMDESVLNSSSSQELRAPSLRDEKMQESITRSLEPRENIYTASPSRFSTKEQIHKEEDDDNMLRRLGTRERMRGLGKKMGEKLEVKRRNIEEKGRSFVERMKGP